ncbi:hypothetical protein D3C83_232300 [compost metagenome]
MRHARATDGAAATTGSSNPNTTWSTSAQPGSSRSSAGKFSISARIAEYGRASRYAPGTAGSVAASPSASANPR